MHTLETPTFYVPFLWPISPADVDSAIQIAERAGMAVEKIGLPPLGMARLACELGYSQQDAGLSAWMHPRTGRGIPIGAYIDVPARNIALSGPVPA